MKNESNARHYVSWKERKKSGRANHLTGYCLLLLLRRDPEWEEILCGKQEGEGELGWIWNTRPPHTVTPHSPTILSLLGKAFSLHNIPMSELKTKTQWQAIVDLSLLCARSSCHLRRSMKNVFYSNIICAWNERITQISSDHETWSSDSSFIRIRTDVANTVLKFTSQSNIGEKFTLTVLEEKQEIVSQSLIDHHRDHHLLREHSSTGHRVDLDHPHRIRWPYQEWDYRLLRAEVLRRVLVQWWFRFLCLPQRHSDESLVVDEFEQTWYRRTRPNFECLVQWLVLSLKKEAVRNRRSDRWFDAISDRSIVETYVHTPKNDHRRNEGSTNTWSHSPIERRCKWRIRSVDAAVLSTHDEERTNLHLDELAKLTWGYPDSSLGNRRSLCQ